jgi:tetratricopeptide (TPR) repeat protein
MDRPQPAAPADAASLLSSGLRRPPLLALALPIVAALLCYLNALGGSYVFDDTMVFEEGSAMARGDWWQVAFGSVHTPLANRPFTCLTFAWNPTLAGSLVVGLRTVNLLLHLANALLVLGVVRRCLLAPNLAGRFAPAVATWAAAATATLWACHPLAVDSVTYITQRSTLLFSLALLTALYAVVRHAAAPKPRRWQMMAVFALAFGMASKEDLVGGPLLVVLFERAFLLPDWQAMRARLRFYAALASTWLVLGACLLLGPSNETVGYASAFVQVTGLQWLLTQASVILHYLQLVVWPQGLRGANDWAIQRDFGAAVVPLLAVAALFGGTVVQWRRRPWLGWLGALFFLLLGPTSSVMPIVTEVVAERRMYLPMLAVLAPIVVVATTAIARRLARAPRPRLLTVGVAVLAAAVLTPAILTTRARAATYQDSAAFWTSAYEQNELRNRSLVASIILCAYANVRDVQGHHAEAIELAARAMQCEARMERVPLTYAEFLRKAGRIDEAEAVLRELVHTRPHVGPAFGLLAFVLVKEHEAEMVAGRADASDPRLTEAVQLAQHAYELDQTPAFLNTLGMALSRQGRLAEAETVLRRAIHQDADLVDAYKTLGAVLCFAGNIPDGIHMWQQTLARHPEENSLRLNIAQACLQTGDTAGAIEMLQEALRREPDNQGARRLLQSLQAGR